MKRRHVLRLLSGVAVTLAVSALPACTYTEAGYRGYRRYPSHEYYYYPDVNVYFHIYSGYYFYRYGGAWRRSRVLPRHIHLDPHRRRRVYAPGRRPYERRSDGGRDFGGADRRRETDRRDDRDRTTRRRDRRDHDDRDRIEGETWRRRPGRRRPD